MRVQVDPHEQVDALGGAIEDLAGQFTLQPLLRRILQRAVSLLGGGAGSICTVDEQAGTYRKEADLGVGCQEGKVFSLEEGVTGAVVARRGPVVFENYREVRGGHVAPSERDRLHATVGVPIEWAGAIIGVCVVFSTDPDLRFHVMAVGKGMLDAACPGDVFAAPPTDYVYETMKLLNSPKGVLLLVNNYTGDKMAFDMAQELAEAEDITARTLFIDDDVAVQDSTCTVGRRGVAGNFFVMKAVGAAAERGADLDELVRIGEKVNSVTRTMGMALTACTPPAKGSPLFDLPADEMEMGVGIHGEPGRRRVKLAAADAIVDELLTAVADDLPFAPGDNVALMINGLGGTPISELYLLYRRAHNQLVDRGITIGRNYVGEYCTSLDMAGASLTLVRLDDEIESLLAEPAEIAIRTF